MSSSESANVLKCVLSSRDDIYLINWDKKSMGNGKMMVEFFSAEMVLNVYSVII